jgi:hypothetical protein
MKLEPAMPFAIANSLTRRGAMIALALSGPMAQVELKLSKTTLMSGSQCQLTATRTDGATPAWAWGPPEAAIATQPDGRVFFTAPEVTVPTWRTVLVTDTAMDPPRTLSKEIHVIPFIPGMPPELAEDILPGFMGRADWEGVANMTLFAGAEGRYCEPPLPRAFELPSTFRLLENDPAMGTLNGRWLVGDGDGLKVLARDGGSRTIKLACVGPVRLLAVRPWDSLATNPHHVVFTKGSGDSNVVHALAPDGSVKVLAGAETPAHGRRLMFMNGPGAKARFGKISALEMAPDGTIFVADQGNGQIRRIDPTGLVTTFAGREHAETSSLLDAPRTGHSFWALGGMVLDPVQGDLYVIDGTSVCRISPAGEVTTILGDALLRGTGLRPADNVMPRGQGCLKGPSEIQIHGRNLFLTDFEAGCLRTFNLDTRILLNLTVPGSGQTRMGPMPCFNPSLEERDCAAVFFPRHLAVSPDGVCLLGLDHGLARVDVRALIAPMGPSETKEETKKETKAQG